MQVCSACGAENPEHARFCLACGSALEEPTAPGEERKVVSVLFVDLVGFTDRSDRADPEDVRATLRPYHERVKADIERYGGTVEKFIGDAVMAVFGAPVAHEDDAERGVRAALRILGTMAELREEGLDVSVRAAVTTGEAVVSLGARPERGEGMVAGDIVNTAARLQSAAPVGSVIVDAATMRSAEGAISFDPMEPVTAKGKQEPIPIWHAVEARSRFGVDTELRAETLFVGRDSELSLLRETFGRALREPSAQLVTVVGEPGVGKSRLVWEFREEIDRRPELVRWRQGRCLPYGEGITFWALGEIVKAEAGVLETDAPAEAHEKVGRAVADAIEDESERVWFTERLAPLVGARDDVTGVGREEAFSAWRRYIEALAAQRASVLVIEDLHWADAALLDFVEDLLDWAPEVPLMVVATARPELYEARPGWGGGRRNSVTLGMSPLTDEDTARLVAALLQRSVLSADTQAALLERAGGNPLYTEQFVRMHVDREDAGEDSLPATVQALIAARLDTLAPELKGILHDAAVVGKVFWTGALAGLGNRSREDVLRGLRELVRREFVRPARVSSMRDEEEFAFWHVLVRDVAYQQIPREPRAAKHVAAAEWIEQRAEDRVSDHAEFLVHHYEQALELARAAGDDTLQPAVEPRLARFLILAGDRAMRLDMAAAEASYRRALELAAETPARAVVLVKLGDALQEQGKLREGRDIYEAGLTALRESRDERLRAVGLIGLGKALWRIGETRRSRELVLEAIGILERERSVDLVSAYEYAAVVDTLAGRSHEGIEWADKGIAFARELGVDNIVRHLQMRGLARIDLGDLGGIEDMREALDLSLRLGLGFETASSYNNLGEVVGGYENIRSGLELTDASREFARRRGMTHHEMWTRSARLWSLYDLGEWDELLEESDELVRWDRAQGGTQIEVNALLTAAPTRAQRGDVERALAEVAIFLPRAREIADPQAVAPALTQAAFINALACRLDDAVRLTDEFERASRGQRWRFAGLSPLVRVCAAAGELELAEKLLDGSPPAPVSSPSRTSAVLTTRAVLAAMRGDTDEAAALFRAAAEGWERWGSVVERAYALLDLGRCGDEQAAREAQAIFGRLRARPFVALAA